VVRAEPPRERRSKPTATRFSCPSAAPTRRNGVPPLNPNLLRRGYPLVVLKRGRREYSARQTRKSDHQEVRVIGPRTDRF